MPGSRCQLSQRAPIRILVRFLEQPLVENEIQVLIYHGEVYHALHNLLQIKKFTSILPIPFY